MIDGVEFVPKAELEKAIKHERERVLMMEWMHTCVHHNDEERMGAKCPVCTTRENAKLQAELEKAQARCAELEAELATNKELHESTKKNLFNILLILDGKFEPSMPCNLDVLEKGRRYRAIIEAGETAQARCAQLEDALQRITTVQGADDCGGSTWQCAQIATAAIIAKHPSPP